MADYYGQYGGNPDEGYWETADDGQGNTYYYHTVTGETTWDNPYAAGARVVSVGIS